MVKKTIIEIMLVVVVGDTKKKKKGSAYQTISATHRVTENKHWI